jgi:hypothetical protein
MGHERRRGRQEDQLTSSIRCREQPDNEPLARPEPATSDICGQKPADEAGGYADDDTP